MTLNQEDLNAIVAAVQAVLATTADVAVAVQAGLDTTADVAAAVRDQPLVGATAGGLGAAVTTILTDRTGYALTAAERSAIVAAFLAVDYTASATANTLGKFFVAVRTLLGHKMLLDANPPTVATFRTKGDVGNAGTQTWSEAGKTRGEYTGF